MSRKPKQVWRMLELEDHIVVIPDPDDDFHGRLLRGGKKAVIEDATAKVCKCRPEVATGEKLSDGSFELWGKIAVTHNSFRDMRRVKRAMNKLTSHA